MTVIENKRAAPSARVYSLAWYSQNPLWLPRWIWICAMGPGNEDVGNLGLCQFLCRIKYCGQISFLFCLLASHPGRVFCLEVCALSSADKLKFRVLAVHLWALALEAHTHRPIKHLHPLTAADAPEIDHSVCITRPCTKFEDTLRAKKRSLGGRITRIMLL